MKRLIAIALLVLMGSLPTAAAGQSTSCDDVAAYLEMVDAAMVEEMYAVVSAPGWAEGAMEAQALLEGSDGTYAGITREEVAPLLDYLGVAGKVLSGIDDSAVPDSARELHDSATGYWTVSMGMIEAMISEGALTSTPSVQQFETLIAKNLAAQDELRASCTDVLQPYEERQDALEGVFAVLDTGDGAGAFADITPEDLEGIGFFFLFFAEEPAEANPVTVNSTPATVKSPPATPGS